MLVALARNVSMSTKMGAHGGAQFAGMLEAQIYGALIQLSADITAYAGRAHTREDKRALDYLKTAHALLGMLALLVRQLRKDLEAAAEALVALGGEPVVYAPVFTPREVDDPPSLDSS